MRKTFFLLLLTSICAQAQVGLNTTTVDPSAQLHIESTNKGFLVPRLDQSQINSIANPAEGLLLFNTSLNFLDWYNGQKWVNPTTTPSSPPITSLIPAANAVEVHFVANLSNLVTGYEVVVQPGNIVVPGLASPIMVSNLAENTTYSFNLIAVTDGGKGVPSSTVSVSTLFSPPAIPNQLDIVPSFEAVTLSWAIPNGVLTNYGVSYKEVNATDWTDIVVNENQITIPNLNNNETYIFKVKAINSSGESTYSHVLYGSPIANDMLLVDNFNDVSLSQSLWNELESNNFTNNFDTGIITVAESSLNIKGTGTNDNFDFVTSKKTYGKDHVDLVVQFNIIMPSCQDIATNTFKYGVINRNTSNGRYFRLGKTNANTVTRLLNANDVTTSHTANQTVDCNDNETIHYRIVFKQNSTIEVYINGIIYPALGALNTSGIIPSGFYDVNNIMGFVGNGSNYYHVQGISVSGKPIRPTRPNVQWEKPTAYAGNSSAVVNFQPASSDGSSAIIHYEITSNPPTNVVYGTTFPILFPNLVNGTSYNFRARAINAFGNSDFSQNSNTIIPLDDVSTPLFYPLNNSVLLQWKAVNDAIDYVIEYKETSAVDWLVFNDEVTTKAQTTVTGLTNSVSYDFRIKPLAEFGVYGFSSVVTTTPTQVYDSNCWNQFLSSGQSLSIGHGGGPSLTTTQPFNNRAYNANENNFTTLPTAPLVEGGAERIYSALANSITQQVGYPQNPFNSIISIKAFGGVPYTVLKKGTEVYRTLIHNATIAKKWSNETELKPYLVRGVTIVHGENDSGNIEYKENLVEWQNDYETDIQAITGQVEPIPMFTCQTATNAIYGVSTSISAMGQLNAALENPGKIVLVTPKYFIDYSDGLHLNNYTYKYLGEYYGKVMKKVIVDRETWLPLHATQATISGNVITVNFHVPAPPLQFDTTSLLEQFNKGFEYFDDAQSADIQSVALGANGTSVIITLTNAPTGANKKVAYAYTGIPGQGAGREKPLATKGNLCDSDPFPVQFPGNYPSYYSPTLKNWCVTFIKNVE